MYKDVGKRITAFLMLVCMLVTLVQCPVPVWAAGEASYSTYRNGDGAVTGETLAEDTAAVVFHTNRDEVLKEIRFEVDIQEGANAKATVAYYVNVQEGDPTAGTRVFQRTEDVSGTTCTVNSDLTSQMMAGDTNFSVVIKLQGASFRTFGGTGAGQSYVNAGAGWEDAYTKYGKCALIQATTVGVTGVGSGSTSSETTAPISNTRRRAAAPRSVDISLTKQRIRLAVGQTAYVQLLNVDSAYINEISWHSEREDIAQVAAPTAGPTATTINAPVTGKSQGTTRIIATYDDKDYVCEVVVTDDIENAQMVLTPPSATYNGTLQKPDATITASGETLVEGENYRLGYQKFVEKDGAFTGVIPGEERAFVDAGRYNVYATTVDVNTELGPGYSGNKQTEFVIQSKDITDGSIEVTLKDVSEVTNWDKVLENAEKDLGDRDPAVASLSDLITGIKDTEVEQKVRENAVGATEDSITLKEGTDYNLSVARDDDGNAIGLKIEGIGNYTGTRTETTPEKLVEGKTEIHLDLGDGVIYNGHEQHPTFSVTHNGKTLSSADYEIVSWGSNNVDATTDPATAPKITIKGIGLYYGEVTASKPYFIYPKDIDNLDKDQMEAPVEVKIGTPTAATEDAIAAALTITYNKLAPLEYGADKDYTIGTITELGSGKYQCILHGVRNYKGTRTIEFTLGNDINEKIADVDGVKVDGTFIYNGLPYTPPVQITWKNNNDILRENEDFVVEYSNNVNAGKATVTLRGIGSYGGTATTTFEISPRSIKEASHGVSAYLLNDAGERVMGDYQVEFSPKLDDLKPPVELFFVRDGSEITLVKDTDYQAAYDDAALHYETDQVIGSKSVTIQGQGNFTGDVTLSYEIVPCDLGHSAAIQAYLDREIVDYTGSQIPDTDLPKVTVQHTPRTGGAPVTLEEGTHYDVSCSKDENGKQQEIGEYTLTVTAMSGSNYTGTLYKTFQITAIDITSVVRKKNITVTNPADHVVKNEEDYTGPYFAMLWYDENKKNNELQFELRDAAGTLLQPRIDYEIVDYNDHDHVSKEGSVATVTIRGIGKYYNECTIQYLLAEDLGQYKVEMSGFKTPTYSGKAVELTPTDIRVYDPGKSLSCDELVFGVDYTLGYQDATDVATSGKRSPAVNAGTAKAFIQALPDDELPSANGCFRYKKDESELEHDFPIDRKDINELDAEAFDVAYTGSAIEPHGPGWTGDYSDLIHIWHGDYLLQENTPGATDKDFYIGSWDNNIEPSPTSFDLAFAEVFGNNNYTGQKTVRFTIKGKSLMDIVDWEWSKDPIVYDGKHHTPTLEKVVFKDGTMIDDPDKIEREVCSLTNYQHNQNAGNASVDLIGKGKYGGSSRTLQFTIKPLPFTDEAKDGQVDVQGLTPSYGYKSVQITPEPTVVTCTVDGTPTKLAAGTDYTLSYDTNLDVADSDAHAAVIVQGKGNYTGEYRCTFTIDPQPLDGTDSDGTAPEIKVLPIDPWEYEVGKEARPIPTVVYTYEEGKEPYTLKPGVDFTVRYEKNDGPGEATVYITGTGNFTNEISATFHIGTSIRDTEKFRVTYPGLEDAHYVYDGSAKKPPVVVEALGNGTWRKLAEGSDYKVSYIDPVDPEEYKDEAYNAGQATIVVEGTGIYAGKVTQPFTIEPKNLGDDDVKLTLETDKEGKLPYTGSPVRAKVTLDYEKLVEAAAGGKGRLEEFLDYTVAYSDNVAIGPVTVTVTAAGTNYTGTKTATFEIARASIGDGLYEPNAGFRIEAIPPQPLVEGKAEPVPVLTYNNQPMTPKVDYDYTWENNTKPGTGTVIITGINNYTGSLRKDFEICENAEGVEIIGLPTTVNFEEVVSKDTKAMDTFDDEGNLGDFAIKFTFSEDENKAKAGEEVVVKNAAGEILKPETDYKVTYKDNDWIGTMTVTITGTSSKLAGSTVRTIPVQMTLPKDDAALDAMKGLTLEVPPVEHTGKPVKGVPKITYYGRPMFEGTHYTVLCTNNTSVGMADITITGNKNNGVLGGYSGQYEITPSSNTFTVDNLQESYMYRGVAIEPLIVVKDGDEVLTEHEDYELVYGTNVQAGVDAGSITITGINTYLGSGPQTVYFDITPWEIANLTVQITPTSAVYTGLEITPTVALTAKINGQSYKIPETDYTVKKTDGANNTDKGSGSLTITGNGVNVIGTKNQTFLITAMSLAKPLAGKADQITVTVTPETMPYTGVEQRPEVKVTYQYGTEAQVRTLVYGDDYSLVYRDNKEAGQATVRVTGNGNYSGYREVHFTIEEQELTDAVITFTDGDSYPYMGTGVAIEPELTVMLGGRTLQKGKDYKVTYTDNKTVGTATATVTGTGSFNGEYQKQFTITTHNINATDINVAPIPNQAYTGVPIVPEVQITCGSYKLVQGVDYNAVISAGDNTNPGVVTMRLEGIGGFTGERNVNFTIATNITKAEVSGIPVELPYKAAQYTIEELSATLRVTLDGRLVSASNYTLSYADGSDGTSAGQQKLILSGVNEYGGTKQLSYTITPKSISDPEIRLAGFVDNITNTADTTQHIQLIWTNKGITLEEKTDYDITYRQEGSSGIFSMIVTGKGNYNGTIEKTYKVEFIDLTGAEITLDKSAYEYTGEDIQPKVTVKLGGIEFKQDENYTVSFENNRNVGVGTVKISGEGYYMGEVTKSFLIVERSISLAVVNDGAGIPAQVYTGKDVEPAIKVTDMIGSRSVTLAEDGDYLLTYDDNRKAGEAWAIVDGIGNYTATQKLRFDILPYTANAPKIVSQTKNSLELGWSTNGAATGYEIQRKTASGSWEHVATVGARNKSFTDTSLAAGTAYTYRIRAYVKGDTNTYYGAWSPEVSGTTRN